MKAVCVGTVLCIFVIGSTFAQPAASPLTFEVASIRPSPADARGFINFLPGGGLRVLGIPLKTLITLAYNVQDFQVSGGPGWINSDRFDINARGQASETPESAHADLTKMADDQRKTMAEQAGISYRTLRRAKDTLGVQSSKAGLSGQWWWSLPAQGGQVC